MWTGTIFVRLSTKELKGKNGEMSKARGAKKPIESQKARALWAMKAAWDRCEDYYDPARKEDILGRTRTRLDLWEEHLKDQIVALAKALECLENPYWVGIWFHNESLPVFVVAMACSFAGARILQKMWEGPYCTSCSSESDLPTQTNAWKVILDLSLHCNTGCFV